MDLDYTAFGDLSFPCKMKSSETGAVFPTMVGAYDAYGASKSRKQLPFPLTLSGVLTATSDTAMQTAINGLLAKKGSYNPLYRHRGNDSYEFVRARCVNISVNPFAHAVGYREVSMSLLVFDDVWYGSSYNGGLSPSGDAPSGDVWMFNDGSFFDSGLDFNPSSQTDAISGLTTTVTINNAGNAPMRNCVIELTATTALPNGFAIVSQSAPYQVLNYGGTVANGDIVLIDCDPMRGSIKNDGVGDYANLSYSVNNLSLPVPYARARAINEWIVLNPGDNVFYVLLDDAAETASLKVIWHDCYH